MFANLTGWHALIIVAIILLLFGAPKIPALAKSLGQSLRIFKTEIKPELSSRGSADDATATPAESDSAHAAGAPRTASR